MREVKEEIGLSLDLSETMPAFTINFDNGFDDTFLVVENITIENITFNTKSLRIFSVIF